MLKVFCNRLNEKFIRLFDDEFGRLHIDVDRLKQLIHETFDHFIKETDTKIRTKIKEKLAGTSKRLSIHIKTSKIFCFQTVSKSGNTRFCKVSEWNYLIHHTFVKALDKHMLSWKPVESDIWRFSMRCIQTAILTSREWNGPTRCRPEGSKYSWKVSSFRKIWAFSTKNWGNYVLFRNNLASVSFVRENFWEKLSQVVYVEWVSGENCRKTWWLFEKMPFAKIIWWYMLSWKLLGTFCQMSVSALGIMSGIFVERRIVYNVSSSILRKN